jgi:hypothetical protein
VHPLRRHRPYRTALVVGLTISAFGCGEADVTAPTSSAPSETSTSSTGAPSTSSVPPTTAALISSRPMRGERYCEILLLGPSPTTGGLAAEVYSTYPLSDCPADEWAAIDATAVAAAAGVPFALANGPRYWLIDGVTRATDDDVVRTTFGTLDMNRYATVVIPDAASVGERYVAQSVNRRAVMTFTAGAEIYVLIDVEGGEYVMQSWSQQVDPQLAEPDLPALGDRLAMPEGWRYEARVLQNDLVIDFGEEPARVLQDELLNSYSRIPGS